MSAIPPDPLGVFYNGLVRRKGWTPEIEAKFLVAAVEKIWGECQIGELELMTGEEFLAFFKEWAESTSISSLGDSQIDGTDDQASQLAQ